VLNPTVSRPTARGVVLFAALCGPVPPALADAVWVGGASGSADSSVVYAGRIAAFPGQRLGDGWAWGVFADTLTYSYLGAPGQVDARSYAVRGGVVRQFASEQGSLGLGVYLSARNTDLSPDDPGNPNSGSQVRPTFELQWNSTELASPASALYSNYVAGSREYYAQGFVGQRIAGGWALGPVAWAVGAHEYRAYGLGLAARDIRLGEGRLGLRLGAEHSNDGQTRVLVGFEFSLYRGD